MIEIIEEQKKQIESLTKSNKEMETDKIDKETPTASKNNFNVKDELQVKKAIAEKDKEIQTVKIFNENLKVDIGSK